ncbi:hypothetical protein QJS04_geneDACA006671 [Acorus gramineus]|uniref:Uncharacterized protein n=1 Tax=Acorus gramineus TaxID=55184 RepID=A0AAV9AV78_ACOGR|nr:hypothetical protein QJS04_geneDACA006671 [Acorus gramineus]
MAHRELGRREKLLLAHLQNMMVILLAIVAERIYKKYLLKRQSRSLTLLRMENLNVFGKDSASGRGCFMPTKLAEDAEQNIDPHIEDESFENIVNEDISVAQPRRTTSTGEEGTQTRRKRRRSSDSFTTGFSDLVEAFKLSANAISDSLNKPDEATIRMDNVFSDVFKILGRDDGHRCLRVSEIIMRDHVKINLLFNMPEELKKDWLESLLPSN